MMLILSVVFKPSVQMVQRGVTHTPDMGKVQELSANQANLQGQ